VRSRRGAIGGALVVEGERQHRRHQRPAQALLRGEQRAAVEIVDLRADRERERAERKRRAHVRRSPFRPSRRAYRRGRRLRGRDAAAPETEQARPWCAYRRSFRFSISVPASTMRGVVWPGSGVGTPLTPRHATPSRGSEITLSPRKRWSEPHAPDPEARHVAEPGEEIVAARGEREPAQRRATVARLAGCAQLVRVVIAALLAREELPLGSSG
jgi:hypothetical protein